MTRPAILVGFAALFIGAWIGLGRAGWSMTLPYPTSAPMHGPLMIGFFATMVSAERAKSRREIGFWAFPILAAAGPLSQAFGMPLFAAGGMALVAALGLLAMTAMDLRSAPSLPAAIGVAGAAALVLGATGWLARRPVADLAPAWATFLLLTIGGERLPLGRGSKLAFSAAALVTFAGSTVAWLGWPAVGDRIFGGGAAALGLWLAWNASSRRATRGFAQLSRVAVLAGSIWAIASGAIAVVWGLVPYDAVLHGLFLGFAFSVVLGHGPSLLETLAGLSLDYGVRFWAPLVALHVSVALRIVGDFAGSSRLRLAGTLGNAIALGLFVIVIATSVALKAAGLLERRKLAGGAK